MEKLINDFKISFTKGDTYAIAVKFKNIAEDLRCAYFTVKENHDDEPLIQKTLGAGIDKIDDREYKSEKTYKVQLQASDTANLEANVQYLYDLQVTIDNVVKTVLSGVFVVHHSVTGVTATTTATLEVVVDDEVETEVLTAPATNGIEYEQDPVATAKIGVLEELTTAQKETVVKAINEVDNRATTNRENISKILNGTISVPKATDADHATNADNATNANNANHATDADHATNADNATEAESAKKLSGMDKIDGTFNGSSTNYIRFKIERTGIYVMSCKIEKSSIQSTDTGIISISDLTISSRGTRSDIGEFDYTGTEVKTTTKIKGEARFTPKDSNGSSITVISAVLYRIGDIN